MPQSVAIRTSNFTLIYLRKQARLTTLGFYHPRDVFILFPPNMVKVHNRGRIFDATICARYSLSLFYHYLKDSAPPPFRRSLYARRGAFGPLNKQSFFMGFII